MSSSHGSNSSQPDADARVGSPRPPSDDPDAGDRDHVTSSALRTSVTDLELTNLDAASEHGVATMDASAAAEGNETKEAPRSVDSAPNPAVAAPAAQTGQAWQSPAGTDADVAQGTDEKPGNSPAQPGHSNEPWRPFEGAPVELLRSWLGVRWKWMMCWPLQHRCMPAYHFTVGEAIIFVVVIAGCIGIPGVMGLGSVEGTGSFAVLPLLATFASVNHNSIWTYLVGIPFERALAWHKFAAYMSVLTGAWHGWAAVKDEGWAFSDSTFLTGVVFWGAMAMLIVSSLEPIRRKLFEVFMYLHIILFIVVIGFGLPHGAGGIMFGVLLYAADVCFRYGYLTLVRNPRQVTLERLPANVVRLSFDKGDFRYKAGQYVFINVPQLSLFQWHPFSISSSPYHGKVMIHIRVLGNWTKALYNLGAKNGAPIQLKCYVEGAYGEPSVDTEGHTYREFLMISGGIGVTPMQSIANEILEQNKRGRPLSKLWFVWSVREQGMVGGLLDWDQQLSDPRMPIQFSPDLLSQHCNSIAYRHEDVDASPEDSVGAQASHPTIPNDDDLTPLHCDYHLTRVKSLDALPATFNVKPEVQECLRFGRPNLPKIFDKHHTDAHRRGNRRVAVLACGPAGLLTMVKKLCWAKSGNGVVFDFHGETFDF